MRPQALAVASWLLVLGACSPSLTDTYRQERAAALRSYTHGRYGEAADHWQKAADVAGSRRRGYEALYRAASALRRAGRHQEARRLLDRIRKESPRHSRAAKAAYDLADIDIETGKQKAGFRQLRAFLHDYPDSGLASGALRRVLIDVEDDGGDEAVLQYLDEQIPKLEKTELGEHLHYAYARRLEAMGRKHDALQRYLFIADNYPYPQGALWDDALWNASLLEEELGRPRRAITHLERLLGEREPSAFMGSYERPRYSQSRFRIAELYRDKLRDQKRARTMFRTVWTKHPTSLLRDDAAWEEARLAHAAGDNRDACRALRNLISEIADSRFVPCAPLLCPSVKLPKDEERECRPYIRRELQRAPGEAEPEAE